jgi:hypothetical protein
LDYPLWVDGDREYLPSEGKKQHYIARNNPRFLGREYSMRDSHYNKTGEDEVR